MNDKKQPPLKKSSARKVAIFIATAAAAAGGTIAWMSREADPTTFKGERSEFEETK